MAYQVGSTCYSTAVEAAQAVASNHAGALVGQAGAVHSVSIGAVAADSISYVLTPAGGGAAITLVAPFTPQPCNMLEASDGLAIGWLVGGAWIATYCVMFLTRALRGETGAEYGNA